MKCQMNIYLHPSIILTITQTSYRITVQISNTTCTVEYHINLFISLECNSDADAFKLIFAHCQFKFNYYGVFSNEIYDDEVCNAVVYFKNCQFLNNNPSQ